MNSKKERINLHLLNSSSNSEDKVLKDEGDKANPNRDKEDNSS